MLLFGYPDYKAKTFNSIKKIATKYPNITKKYFSSKKENIEIIKMDGSLELAPIVGLADAIVDIVQTGDTLKANRIRSNRKNKSDIYSIDIK